MQTENLWKEEELWIYQWRMISFIQILVSPYISRQVSSIVSVIWHTHSHYERFLTLDETTALSVAFNVSISDN